VRDQRVGVVESDLRAPSRIESLAHARTLTKSSSATEGNKAASITSNVSGHLNND
jgi:hypothetical protein